MKTLEELGISPAPWSAGGHWLHDADDEFVAFPDEEGGYQSATLCAAAPKLYKCLREAVIEMCHNHACCGSAPEYKCNGVDGNCFVKRWRAALAKAAGEEVAK